MIKTTLWRPDTCDCQIEYSWDDQTSDQDRQHTLSRVVVSCPEHQGLTAQQVYDSVLTENRAKNAGVSKITEALSLQKEDIGNIKWTKDIQTKEYTFDISEIEKTKTIDRASLATELTKIGAKLKAKQIATPIGEGK